MKVEKTYPRLLVRWRGSCWEVHFIGNRLVQPSDGSLIGVAWTWSALLRWVISWEMRTAIHQPSYEDLRRSGNQAHIKRMAVSHWKFTAWNEGGMHCPS